LPEEDFFALFCRWAGGSGQEPVSYDAETQYRSSSKSNSFSAFLQSIAVDKNFRSFVESPTGRFRGLSAKLHSIQKGNR
jgi:hypothetical protein